MSDSATTTTAVIDAIQSTLEGVTGLSAATVLYGIGAGNTVPSGKLVQWRPVEGRLAVDGGNLRSDLVDLPCEVRIYAPATADTPRARDAAILDLWQTIRAHFLANRTLGSIVRDCHVSSITLPTSAADLGLPSGAGVCVLTARWQWKAVP